MRNKIILLFLMLQHLLSGQFSDGFDDGEFLTNPEWKGNTSHFRVDDSQKLRLNASHEGNSWLYTSSSLTDSFELGVKIKMEFSPSASNALKFYFLLDDQDFTIANGYYIQLGENGSSDRLKIFKLTNGVETLLAEGQESALAKDPAICNLKLTYRDQHKFVLLADYDDNGSFDDHVEFQDNVSITGVKTIGFYCVYTATRVDKFVFDDVYLKPFELDKTSPALVDLQVLNSNELLLIFDENLEKSSVEEVMNYTVNQGVGSPITAFFEETKPNQVVITFVNPFISTSALTLSVSNVTDVSGNKIATITKEFLFAASPNLNDLMLSEILFNPYTDGEDFIELYNASDKFIELKDLMFVNLDNSDEDIISSSFVIKPKSYVAITSDADNLINAYQPPFFDYIIENNLPALNNDAGTVVVYNQQNVLLDSFSYHEDLHFGLIDDVEGVSLEKINLVPFDNSTSNWHSASSAVKYATPGYKNSNTVQTTATNEEFSLQKKVFSPDGDAKDDIMILTYNLPESGYVANVSVYSSEGYLVKNLTKNELLGRQGVVTWDGTNEDGMLAKLGIYIVIGTVFDSSGNTKKFKKDCVLATYID